MSIFTVILFIMAVIWEARDRGCIVFEISPRFYSNTQCHISKDSRKICGRLVIHSNFTRQFNWGIAVNICVRSLLGIRADRMKWQSIGVGDGKETWLRKLWTPEQCHLPSNIRQV